MRKNFWCELRRDWDLFLIILIACALAVKAAKAEVPTPVCDAMNATARFEVDQETPRVHGLIWYCNTPTGYKQMAAALVTGPQMAALAEDVTRTYIAFGWKAAWQKAYARKATADEENFLLAEIEARKASGLWPVAKVKASSTADKARAVMLLKTDGTLAAYKVGTVAQRILQALPCNARVRAPGTIYFDVAGQKSITGNTLPARTFAECTVTPPES